MRKFELIKALHEIDVKKQENSSEEEPVDLKDTKKKSEEHDSKANKNNIAQVDFKVTKAPNESELENIKRIDSQ